MQHFFRCVNSAKIDMKQKDLSVIIVSYNCLPLIKQCVDSIDMYNDIGESLEVIVVDNSSDDETMEWLRNERPDIISIANENKGFGHGNNVGADASRGRYLLFLNPDTILIEPVFRYAIDKFESDPKLGMFGVRLLDSEQKRNHSFLLRWVPGMLRTKMNDILVALDIFIPSKMFTLGADIFIRKDLFYEAGCFDDSFFMYCEEADLTNRVNRSGMKNRFFRDKRIIHLEGKTQASPDMLRTYKRLTESRKHYCSKYGLDFQKNLNKELRYCRFKKTALAISGKRSKVEGYNKIIDYIEQTLVAERGQ